MSSVVTRYFNINRILLFAVGLWPYQQSKLVQFQVILSLSILASFITFQLTTFMTAEFSLNLVINVLSSVLCFISFVISYFSFWINVSNVKSFLEQLQQLCSELKDENEITIIEKYGSNAKRFTIAVLLFCIFIVSILIIEPIWMRMLDVLLYINESRPHNKMYIMTEYFIDEEKYFYLILLHMDVAVYIGVMITLATGSTIIVCFKYACGMFKIASYRIEQAITINMLKNINLEKDFMVYKKLVFAVDIHRKAMQFSEFLTSSFEVTFFLLIGIAVITMSLNLYGLASFKNDFEQLLPPFTRISGVLLCVFISNYTGQEIIDHSNHVFFTAYNIHWYKAPLHIQKLILFILQRSSKAVTLNIGGLFIVSLDGFATLATESISYFTFIYSTSQ